MVKYLEVEGLYDDSVTDDEHPLEEKFNKGGEKSSKKKELNNTNPDLRLINDYFKEVANESLLTPKQELSVSAEVCSCEKRIEEIKNIIQIILKKRIRHNTSILIKSLKHLLQSDNLNLTKNKHKKLFYYTTLLEVYYNKAN
ncbi:MAG: hypothetical protein ACR2NC_01385, partial [Thermodesulfobacteriota bacterium]